MRKFFSIKGVFTTRSLVVMAMMVALSMGLARFGTIYITPQIMLSPTYLPGAMVAMLYGPWAALTFGLVANTAMGFITNLFGSYFFGYALSEMLSYLIYACFLYRQPLKIWRVAAAQLVITVFILFGLNFVWLSMLWGALASTIPSSTRLIYNLIQLPIHVAFILIMARITLLVMQRSKITG